MEVGQSICGKKRDSSVVERSETGQFSCYRQKQDNSVVERNRTAELLCMEVGQYSCGK